MLKALPLGCSLAVAEIHDIDMRTNSPVVVNLFEAANFSYFYHGASKAWDSGEEESAESRSLVSLGFVDAQAVADEDRAPSMVSSSPDEDLWKFKQILQDDDRSLSLIFANGDLSSPLAMPRSQVSRHGPSKFDLDDGVPAMIKILKAPSAHESDDDDDDEVSYLCDDNDDDMLIAEDLVFAAPIKLVLCRQSMDDDVSALSWSPEEFFDEADELSAKSKDSADELLADAFRFGLLNVEEEESIKSRSLISLGQWESKTIVTGSSEKNSHQGSQGVWIREALKQGCADRMSVQDPDQAHRSCFTIGSVPVIKRPEPESICFDPAPIRFHVCTVPVFVYTRNKSDDDISQICDDDMLGYDSVLLPPAAKTYERDVESTTVDESENSPSDEHRDDESIIRLEYMGSYGFDILGEASI